MKKQWQKFIDDNASKWAYGIVPALVRLLSEAQKTGNIGLELYVLNALTKEGVTIDKNGDLCFTIDLILNKEV